MSTILLHYSYGAIIASLILAIFLMAKGYHADKRLLEQRLANTQDRLLNKIYKINGLQAELNFFKGEVKPHSHSHKLISEPPTRVPHTRYDHYPRPDDLYRGQAMSAHWMIQPGVAYSNDSRNTCSSNDSSSSDSSSSSSSSTGGCE